jgi:hypothetical protein
MLGWALKAIGQIYWYFHDLIMEGWLHGADNACDALVTLLQLLGDTVMLWSVTSAMPRETGTPSNQQLRDQLHRGISSTTI